MSLPGVTKSVIPFIEAEHVLYFANLLPRQLDSLLCHIPKECVLALCEEIIPQLSSLTALRSIAEFCSQVCSPYNFNYNLILCVY